MRGMVAADSRKSPFTATGLGSLLVVGVVMLLGPAAASGQVPSRIDPPFVPSSMEMVERMMEMVGVGPGDVVYDLGSGDGRIPIAAVSRYGAERAVGIEIDPELVQKSRENARRAGVADRVTIMEGDLFEQDFSEATVVTLYLFQHINILLRPRLLEQLRPGTRIVSHEFHMGDWAPDRSHPEAVMASPHPGPDDEDIPFTYSWIVPAQVAGAWDLSAGNGLRALLRLAQSYQMLSGDVRTEAGPAPLRAGRVTGEQVRFDIVHGDGGLSRFDGRLDGTTIQGTVTMPDGRTGEFRASRID